MAKWGLGDIIGTVATGGAYGAYKAAKDNQQQNNDANSAQQALYQQYRTSEMDKAKDTAEERKKQYYGNTLSGLGGETENYVSRLQGNLDKNVARADIYNQQAGQQRALSNARAGLSGTDTTAMNEQARRNAQFASAGINEDAKRSALDLYGKSIGNRIQGANTIEQSTMATALAGMDRPETNYNPGLIGSLFGGFA